MNPLILVMIIIAVVALISSAVIMIALNSVSASRVRSRRKTGYHPSRRAFKDVL